MKVMQELVPIIKEGGAAKASGDYICRDNLEADDERQNWLSTPNPIILGVNLNRGDSRGAQAEWEFTFPKAPEIVKAELKIVTFRTHGGLHTSIKDAKLAELNSRFKEGRLIINGRLMDAIHLVKQMKHGRDYGFNRLDPYPVFYWVKEAQKAGKAMKIRLEVDSQVAWDIDWLELRLWRSV